MFQRPTSITVLAVLGFIIGFLAVTCSPIGILGMIVEGGSTYTLGPNFELQKIPFPRGVTAVLIIGNVVSFIGGILLLAGSIGSMQMRAWARTCMNAYAALAIVNGIVTTLVQVKAVLPTIMQSASQSVPQGSGGALVVGMVFGLLGAILCSILYPLAVLYFYNTLSAREAFANGGYVTPPTPYGYYPQAQQPYDPYSQAGGAPGYGNAPPSGYQGQPMPPQAPPPGFAAPQNPSSQPPQPQRPPAPWENEDDR